MGDEDIAVSSAHDFAASWQPIETAPRDETDILLGWKDNVCQGYFHILADGWRSDIENIQWECEPTHWMPLPDPPDDKNA